jgi:hypothetical protein
MSKLAVASFATCFALTILWICSYLGASRLCYARHQRAVQLEISRGELLVELDYNYTSSEGPSFYIEPFADLDPHYFIARYRPYCYPAEVGPPVAAPTPVFETRFAVFGLVWQRSGVPAWQVLRESHKPVWATSWENDSILLPFWFLTSSFAMLSLLCARRDLRQRYRAWRQQCLACGYDLRASPGRCPECGTDRPPTDTLLESGHS